MTWSEAFFRQAASDFTVHELLSSQSQLPPCHGLHYLQMATEKLAKSFLCHGAASPPRESHAVVVSFIKSCASNRRLRDRFQMEHQAFSSMLRKHVRTAEYIESLAPAMSHDINSEYPWPGKPPGAAVAPCDYEFSEISHTELAQFKFFISQLLKIQAGQ